MPVTAGTPITLTVTQFFGGLLAMIVAIIGGFWTVSSIQVGGLHDQIASIHDEIVPIRTAVTNLQGADKDSVIRLNESAEKLTGKLRMYPKI
jgi:hypothetical protein